MVVGPGRPVVASVAYDLPVAGGTGLALASEGCTVTTEVDAPLRTRSRCAARRRPSPTPAAEGVYRGEAGDATSIAFDLEWETDGAPYHYEVTTRYEVPCPSAGELSIGDERVAVDGQGQRDHSWGVRDWWAFGWCWAAARLDDGTRLHLADIRIPGHPDRVRLPATARGAGPTGRAARRCEEELGTFGMPTNARGRIEPAGLGFEVEPVAYGPLLLVAPDGRRSRFPRAYARFRTDDGRAGAGWIEWNQPEAPEGSG